MELAVSIKTARMCMEVLGESGGRLNYVDWQNTRKRETTMTKINISDIDVSDIEKVHKVMKANDEEETSKVHKLLTMLKDPDGKKAANLAEFVTLFKAFLKANDNPLLHATSTDLRGIAYLPMSVELVRPERDRNYFARRDDYVEISLVYNTKLLQNTYTITLYLKDLHDSIPSILKRRGLMVPDETMTANYQKIIKRFEEYGGMHGEQFLCRGEAPQVSNRNSYWWGGEHSRLDLSNLGKPSKAVLDIDLQDTTNRYNKQSMRPTMHSDIYGSNCKVPTHPVLPLFSLLHHKNVWVNVINMKKYEYEEDLMDKLVLPKAQTRLVGALVSNLEALRDENDADNKSKTIKAKASSSVILSKGPAGTGKTLMAEVYSETIKRPMYEVQSGQIGTHAEEIESNLQTILARAIRLRMPLLINEADVFIKTRGDDVEQNAIVSVFLRLLEYHNGLVFLTTNRSEDIDDAILSRCLAEIQFDIPKPSERRRLWRILLAEFNAALPKSELNKAVLSMPEVVGRDIQNLIRLTNRVCKALDEPFNLEALQANAAFKSIKVLSDEELEAAKAARDA